MLVEGGDELLHVGVDAQVGHLEPGALQHHGHQVLADVVDVALDGSDDHAADGLGPGLGQKRAQDGHARLHGVGGQQHLGHEQDAVAEVDAHDAHPLHQGLVQHLVGGPAPVEQDSGALVDLLGQAVIKIVVHLRTEVFVVQTRQIDVVDHGRVSHTTHSFCGAGPHGGFHTVDQYRNAEQCYYSTRSPSVRCLSALPEGRSVEWPSRRSFWLEATTGVE